MSPGQKIKQLMQERQYSSKMTAMTMGIREQTFSHYKRDQRKITIAIAVKLSEVLGLEPLQWLDIQTRYQYQKYLKTKTKPK